jgi:PHB accumulation regulatory protein
VRDCETTSVLVKRYDDERLYDTGLKRYITIDDLYAWQLMSVPFVVRDARSGEDITTATLLERPPCAEPDGVCDPNNMLVEDLPHGFRQASLPGRPLELPPAVPKAPS